MPREYINQESAVPWNLIPLTDTEPHKDISEKAHNSSAYLSKDIVSSSSSQSEANRNISNSENGSNLPNTRDKLHSEIKSENVHLKTNKSITYSSNRTLHTVSTDPVSRHFLLRDEYKSYSKYKSEINLHSENNRSSTHSKKASPEHHSYSRRWESYKIPRKIRETSVSRALRSLRSRSRSVSQSRTVPQTVSTIAKQRYGDRASSHCRSSVVTETSHKHTDRALKLPESDPSAYNLKTQLPKDTQIETSKNLISKPQKKSTQDSELHSITGAANAELEYSLKIPKIGSGAKMQMSPSVGSTCGTGFATVSNLSEHGGFKRSRRAKIVKLPGSETKPREVTNSDLVKNTNSKLASEHNHRGGMKRPLETNETEESHLPDSIRQVVYDVTGIEGYNYRENDDSTEHKQKYNGAVKNQPSSSSVNENVLKTNKFPKEKSSGIQNVDAAVLEEKNKANQSNEETGPNNIRLDYKEGNDKQPIMENTVKDASGNMKIKSDCPGVKETNKNVNLKETDRQYGGHAKFRSDRMLFDTKRKSLGSCRPQYISQRYHERSSTQITFNSQCKRRSPSELLNKDRTGRRLNNHNEKARTTRSRSRSFEEGTSMYRETKRYKVTDNADGRYEANNVSSESEKNNRCSGGENNKLNSSQNHKEEKEKHKVETDRLTQNKASRQEEDCNRNVQNMCLLNTNRSNSVMNSRILDDCSGQIKLMRRPNSSISTALNETQKSYNKVLQHELSRLPFTNPSGLNEIIKTNISENNQISVLRSKSTELNADIASARRDSCEKGSRVLRVAENTRNSNSESADEKCVTHETYNANCKDERKKNKKPKDKIKESYTNNSHNNENNKEGNGKNSAEVEQIKQIPTKESGKEEVHNNNFQKENLLESSTKGGVMEGHCSVERLKAVTPDTVTKTQKSDCMEQQQQQYELSRQPVTEPLAPGQIIRAGGQENSLYFISKSSSVELRERKCVVGRDVADSLDETCTKKINDGHPKNGGKKSGSSDNAEGAGKNNVINVTKNKINNRKEAKSGRREEHGENVKKSLPDTNKKSIIMKPELDTGCKNPIGSTVKETEDVIKIMVNEIHNTGVKNPQHGPSSQPVAEQSICDEANKTGKAKRMLKDSIIHKTSNMPDSKCTKYVRNKAVSEKETNKHCERAEKMPANFQKYVASGQNTVCGTEIEETIPTVPQKSEVFDNLRQKGTKCNFSENEYKKNDLDSCQKKVENKQSAFQVSQKDVINARASEMRQKYENYSQTVQPTSTLDKNTEGGEARVDEVKDNAPITINEKLNSCCKELKNGLSDNHTTKPSLASNENENNRTKKVSRSHDDRSRAMRKPQRHKMTDSTDETSVICKTHSVESEERKKSKYSNNKNKKLSISRKDKEIVGKKDSEAEAVQTGADNIKCSETARKEEEINRNVHKTRLLESNSVHILTCTKPEVQNCGEGQTVSAKGVKDVKLTEADCKEMQNGKHREPTSELSVSHEVVRMGVAEIIPKSASRDNSTELSAESSTVSSVINLKFRTRRSVENKLQDSKAVLSVNITPPKAKITDLIAECPDMSAVKK
jgi:hypothetical protein